MSTPRILHYPGSKWNMADFIIKKMPEHTTYLEPYFGSGAVFFKKNPSVLETINDIDGDVVNLFKVIRENPDELSQAVYWTPYARQEFYNAYKDSDSEIDKARRFLVRCWQAIRVKTGSISGWKCRGTADDSYRIKQWKDLPDKLVEVAKRLKDVQIENRPALQVIERYNRNDVLIYADPPYILSSRNGAIYENEMTDDDHIELIDTLSRHTGPVFLSSYANELYDSRLKGWQREEKQQVIETGQARTEVLWINPIAAKQSTQLNLFDCLR